MYDKLVTKVNAIDDKISRTTGLVKQTSQVSKKKKKRQRMFTKRYPTLVGWSKRLITTNKSQRLNTRPLVLLILLLLLLLIQKP